MENIETLFSRDKTVFLTGPPFPRLIRQFTIMSVHLRDTHVNTNVPIIPTHTRTIRLERQCLSSYRDLMAAMKPSTTIHFKTTVFRRHSVTF